MTHQHGGRPGSSGRGQSGGGASDVGSRNWEIAHGIDVGSLGNKTGGGGSGDSEDYEDDGYKKDICKPEMEEQPKEKSTKKLFFDSWKLFVNNNESDLSDVISIDRPDRYYPYWTITYKNGKKTRITGNVVLEEI